MDVGFDLDGVQENGGVVEDTDRYSSSRFTSTDIFGN